MPGVDLIARVAQHRTTRDDADAADHGGSAGVGGAVVGELSPVAETDEVALPTVTWRQPSLPWWLASPA